MSTLFGWSWDQWAIAAARLGRPEQATLATALRLKRQWQMSNIAEPGEIQLANVPPLMDHEFVADLLSRSPVL